MRRLRAGLVFGLVLMLFYVAVRGSAAAWEPYEETMRGESIGWAARCGGQALDVPGYRVLGAVAGATWALNHGDAAALVVVGLPMAALFVLGLVLGLVHRPRTRPPMHAPSAPAEVHCGQSLALIALAVALVGMAAYGFVTGFIAVVIGLRARRHMPKAVAGRGWALLAVMLGTVEALAWLAVLVTTWHPTEA